MYVTRTLARRLAAAALTLAAIAAALIVAVVATAGDANARVYAGEPADIVDPFLHALLDDAELPANANDLSAAADRVCEGMTAGVPLMDMADVIGDEFSVGEEQAHEFVKLVAQIRCAHT